MNKVGITILLLLLLPFTTSCQQYNGIDVSHHNGDIDWKLVSNDKNIQFVYIKATE